MQEPSQAFQDQFSLFYPQNIFALSSFYQTIYVLSTIGNVYFCSGLFDFIVINWSRVILMNVGTKIKEARTKMGLTQKQFGELCGMADSAIRRYESGRGNPTIKTLQRIAKAIGVHESYFWANSPYPTFETALKEYKEFTQCLTITSQILDIIETIYGKKEFIRISDDQNFFVEKFYSFGSGENSIAINTEDLPTIEDAVSSLIKSLCTSLSSPTCDAVAHCKNWFNSEQASVIRRQVQERANERAGDSCAIDPQDDK